MPPINKHRLLVHIVIVLLIYTLGHIRLHLLILGAIICITPGAYALLGPEERRPLGGLYAPDYTNLQHNYGFCVLYLVILLSQYRLLEHQFGYGVVYHPKELELNCLGCCGEP